MNDLIIDKMNEPFRDFGELKQSTNPEDFIGYENDMFKVVDIDTEKQTISLILKGELRTVTVDVNVGLSALRFKLPF